MARRSEKQQFEDWLLTDEWDVFGTLKFQPMRNIGGRQAHDLLRHFWNRLDRVLYGKAAEHGCRVVRWCFAHEGSRNDNYHLHFVASSSIDPDMFCCLANTVWTKLDRATAALRFNSITPVVHREKVADYITKEIWKLGSDSFDGFLTCKDATPFIDSAENVAAQGQRIARAMTANDLVAAHAALAKHKVEAERNLALRGRKQSSKATCK